MAKVSCLLAGLVAWNLASALTAKPAEQAAEHGYLVNDEPTVTPESLRAEGPAGLERALRAHDGLQDLVSGLHRDYARLSRDGLERNKAELEKISRQIKHVNQKLADLDATIDVVGGQRGCTVSRLYWYTDLAKAKAAAERTGRPILSLRMLGKLTDEFSCANSRFFRTTLYSNKEISNYLRNNFVLHWQSVRPVPRVTIDFGDGRKLERTLTGNSAHYALASDGTPLDVLPGLYSPQEFLKWLRTMHDLDESYNRAARAETAPGPARAAILKRYHEDRHDAILREWDRDLQRLGAKQTELISSRINIAIEAAKLAGQSVPNTSAPPAKAAALRAVAKSVAEVPLLRFTSYGGEWMEKGMDDDLWNAIAKLHRADVHLDESSIAVMQREAPPAAVATRLTATKAQVENPILRMVRTFEDSISLDTVRNEYLLHRRVHELLAKSDSVSMDFDALNEWVYAKLFLTPSTDPWLGLAPPDVYTALNNGGCVVPTAQAATRNGR